MSFKKRENKSIKISRFSTCLFFVLLLSLANLSYIYGQEGSLEKEGGNIEYWKKDAFIEIPIESLNIDPSESKQKSKEIIQKYNSQEFNYYEDTKDNFSFWERIERRISQIINALFPNLSAQSHKATLYVLIIFGIAALVFTVYKVVFSGKKVIGKELKEKEKSELRFIEKNLEHVDLEGYFNKAMNENNYDLAIRYLHLSNLQALSLKGIIEWNYRKTNTDFLNEIKDKDLQERFQQSTSIFNYVWFGNFKLDKNQFENYKNELLDFKNQIHRK